MLMLGVDGRHGEKGLNGEGSFVTFFVVRKTVTKVKLHDSVDGS